MFFKKLGMNQYERKRDYFFIIILLLMLYSDNLFSFSLSQNHLFENLYIDSHYIYIIIITFLLIFSNNFTIIEDLKIIKKNCVNFFEIFFDAFKRNKKRKIIWDTCLRLKNFLYYKNETEIFYSSILLKKPQIHSSGISILSLFFVFISLIWMKFDFYLFVKIKEPILGIAIKKLDFFNYPVLIIYIIICINEIYKHEYYGNFSGGIKNKI